MGHLSRINGDNIKFNGSEELHHCKHCKGHAITRNVIANNKMNKEFNIKYGNLINSTSRDRSHDFKQYN